MALPAVGIDQHGIGTLEHAVVVHPAVLPFPGRPAHVVDLDPHPGHVAERLLKEQTARPELVHAGRMARTPGDEDDPLVGAAQRDQRDQHRDDDRDDGQMSGSQW
jgi:hypothetical protein